jgi:hypothetical protein
MSTEIKSCSCGCNSCGNKAPLLTEGITFQQPISENLLYHINNKKPLTENTFRYGSTAFLNLWKEARTLYSRNILSVGDEDEHILLETHLGEYGMFEGERVPLDLLMEEEETIEEISLDSVGAKELVSQVKDNPSLLDKLDFSSFADFINFLKYATIDDWYQIRDEVGSILGEAKYQGKEVALGKPKRGGSKKFYVYVMNPKTKKVKKVSFGGTTGLTAKINDSEARTNFAKRHNCAEKKDKTKPGYWACRLPRYASLLGLKGSYSGYW